jgi:hypothetical protein
MYGVASVFRVLPEVRQDPQLARPPGFIHRDILEGGQEDLLRINVTGTLA